MHARGLSEKSKGKARGAVGLYESSCTYRCHRMPGTLGWYSGEEFVEGSLREDEAPGRGVRRALRASRTRRSLRLIDAGQRIASGRREALSISPLTCHVESARHASDETVAPVGAKGTGAV